MWGSDDGEGDKGREGGGTSGEGRLLCPRRETYMRYPRAGNTLSVKIPYAFHRRRFLDVNVPMHVSHPERKPIIRLGQATSVPPDSVVGSIHGADAFLFRNKHRSNTAGRRFPSSSLCCLSFVAYIL